MEQIVDEDDFEDLYSDVEALARSSVINAEKIDIDDDKEGDDGSDSEDDLHILLDDDGFRPSVSQVNDDNVNNGVFTGAGNGNEKDAHFVVASKAAGFDGNHFNKTEQESVSKGVDTGNNGSQLLQYKYMKHNACSRDFDSTAKENLAVAARDHVRKIEWNEYNCSGSNQVARRHLTTETSCFKLPMMRNKTILNANIDKFDHKPWRDSRVDVTDFFNFGFNEQSWKEYCRSVALQCKLEYEEMCKEAIIARSLKQPIGRAIQVEESTSERPSTMDVKLPVMLESDVVIQITGKDSVPHHSSSDKDLDLKSGSLLDTSQNEDTCSTVSAGLDKVSITSLEGSIRNSDSHSGALPRCSEQEASFNSTPMDSDKQGDGQLSDLESKHSIKLKTSEGNAVSVEQHINEKKVLCKNSLRADPSMKETESSSDGQLQLTPSSSLFGSESEASEDDIEINTRGWSFDSVAVLPKVYQPGYNVNSSDNNNVRDKPGYSKGHARRYRSLLQERQTTCSRRPHDKVYGGSESPDKEFLFNKYHSHVTRRGKHGRRRNFGYYHKEDTSLDRATYHHNERLTDGHHRNANPRSYPVHYNPRFKDEIDPYYKRRCNEGQYFDKGTTAMRDYYHTASTVSTKDTGSRMQRESMKWDSEYPFYFDNGKDLRWTRGRSGNVHYFESNERSDPWCDYGLVDDFIQGEKRRDLPFPNRHCGCMDERCSRCAASTVETFGRRDDSRIWDRFDDCPTSDAEYSRLRGIKSDGWRHVDYDPYSSSFHRQSQSHSTNVHRSPGTVSPEDVFDFGFTEDLHGRSRRGSYSEKFKDDDRWLSEKDAAYYGNNIASFSNLGRSARIGSHFQSRAFLGAERRLFSRQNDYTFDSNDTSFPNERDERVHATNIYSHGWVVMDEKETEQHHCDKIREGNKGRFLSTTFKPPYNCKNEQKIARCSDSADFVGWVGKFNERRRIVAENFMCDKSWKEKVESGSNEEENEWLDKFPVSGKDEGLEVEEGQIVTDEVDMSCVMKDENARNGKKVPVEGINEDRIRQSLAKMEKRRERFKEPIASRKEDMDTNLKAGVDAETQKGDITQGRPVRKRKWGKS